MQALKFYCKRQDGTWQSLHKNYRFCDGSITDMLNKRFPDANPQLTGIVQEHRVEMFHMTEVKIEYALTVLFELMKHNYDERRKLFGWYDYKEQNAISQRYYAQIRKLWLNHNNKNVVKLLNQYFDPRFEYTVRFDQIYIINKTEPITRFITIQETLVAQVKRLWIKEHNYLRCVSVVMSATGCDIKAAQAFINVIIDRQA